MASLDELRRAVFPTAIEVVTGGDEARAVGWVRVLKSRVPAFDALERGDLAILPDAALEALAAAGVEPLSIADALDRAGASAALFIGEDEPTAAAAAAARLASLGIPGYRLAGADPAVVERSVIGFLVNERAELERQAVRLEQQLAALALRGADLAEHAAAVAAFLGRAVAIEGPRGEALVVHAPAGHPDAAAAAARYLRRPRRAVLRTPLPPVGGDEAGGRTSGSLALLGDEPATELERLCCAGVASLLALELGRADDSRLADRPESLPADGPPWVVLVARQVSAGSPSSVEERARLRARLRRLAPARRMALRGDPTSLEIRVVAALPEADPDGIALAGRAAGLLERSVAVSRPFVEAEDRPIAEAEARATLEAVEAIEPWAPAEPPRVIRADLLAAYRLLGSLQHLPDGRRQAELLLEPLLSARPARRAERLRTLRAVLDAPGLAEAALRLGIHRNTLAYRLARIEAATGWRLEDGDLRTALALAVRLVQNDQVQNAQAGRSEARRHQSSA